MFDRMYLTLREVKDMDMADVHAIVESMPAYKLLSEQVKTDYFLAMMHYIEGQEINPFMELMLTEGVLIWKENKIMETKLTQWISPELINQTFSRMRDTVSKVQNIQIMIANAKTEIEQAMAKMSSDPDFKWGKNETERSAQVAVAYPELVAKLTNAKIEEQKLLDEKELVAIDLQELHTLIDFFKVFNDIRE